MSEYKRLTRKVNGRYVQYSITGCYNDMNGKGDYTTGDSVEKFAKLENKLEDGKLIFIDEPFYSEKHQCWAVFQRDEDIVQTRFMTEQQAKEYKSQGKLKN